MSLAKHSIFLVFATIFFVGCAPKPSVVLTNYQDTLMTKQSEKLFFMGQKEDFDELLHLFRHNCTASQAQKIYPKECEKSLHVKDSKAFFINNFELYKIEPNQQRSLLTGYYVPLLQGSLVKSERFKYPVYAKPNDLLSVELGLLYPELKSKRVRGRVDGNKVVPYYSREEIAKQKINSEILCYVDDKIDLFFMEVQGSGRVALDNGDTLYIGYADVNGHSYKSLGKEMINRGIFSSKSEVSLQSIKHYLKQNPSKADELLNTNPSYVFFRKMTQKATGSLGLVLTPERSVAVDKSFIPLGSLLVVKSQSDEYNVDKFVFAQDTGGAIKGPNRADMFMGYGTRAESIAGELKSPLEIWIMLPKK
ncbi:MAG: murein transglycosylase A [Sulfurospirillaceae bacterium]|nr:murein transglycosylase A [Sulfurospirillaceae bacterium]